MKKISFLLLILLVSYAPFADSQTEKTFDRIAEEVDATYRRAVKDRELTLEDIAHNRALLMKKKDDLKKKLVFEEDNLAHEESLLKDLTDQRDALKKEISTHLASKDELDAIITEHARNFLALAEKSPYSAEKPERIDFLKKLVSKGTIIGMADLSGLFDLYFDDMEASGKIISGRMTVLDRSGNEKVCDYIRLGHETSLFRSESAVGFLTLSPASERLIMSAAPPYLIGRNLTSYFDGESNDVYMDITGGVAVAQLARKESLIDELKSGGVLVIPILLVGVAALVLTIERFLFLGRVRHNTDDLMKRVTDMVASGNFEGAMESTLPHRKGPTARVIKAGLACVGETREIIESRLSEAILKETPRLERFIGTLKVLAAVAPLLGLLGTVTGMINTFQVITTHGTGDPRLMAGGISEAMVTTQVGLAVAIPVMMVAAFLGRRAQALAMDMEEKGLALMAAILKTKGGA